MSFVSAPVRQDWRLLGRYPLAGLANTLLPVTTDFAHYRMRLRNVSFSQSSRFDLRVSLPATGIETGKRYDWRHERQRAGVSAVDTGSAVAATLIECTPTILTNHRLNGDLIAYDCGNSEAVAVIGSLYWDRDQIAHNAHANIDVVAAFIDEKLINGIQVRTNAGNFAAGEILWYGSVRI